MPILWWGQLLWLLALALGAFLVTWVFADLLRMAQAPYIGVLAIVTGAFLAGYGRWSGADWGEFLGRRWPCGLLGAVVVGALLIPLFLRSKRAHPQAFASAPRPRGLRLAAALLWEGLVYGAAEGVLLSVLPVLITWDAVSSLGWAASWYGAAIGGAVALAASAAVIVLHHLGYREFRGRQLVFALGGCAPLGLAYLLTMNPLAATVGHSLLHMGAVLTSTELPPHQEPRGQVAARMAPAH